MAASWTRSLHRHISGAGKWRPPLKKAPATTTILLFLFILIAAAFISSSWICSYTFSVNHEGMKEAVIMPEEGKKAPTRVEIPLNCSIGNLTQTCPGNYPTNTMVFENEVGGDDHSLNSTCPDYFRWIHEDLRPFKATGITRDMVERAKTTAHFRMVIVKGKVYVEKYQKSIQTRDLFTLWGILQLLRRYPGKLPDLELVFDCNDRPVINSGDHRGPNATAPPPLFRYCGDQWTLDIVFPDWSFWGW